jgi:glycosyltransferase involved in cell wall biosynthesis
MRIVAMVHGYPPFQNAGAEWMLHEMLKFLRQGGHSCEVLVPVNKLEPYNFEGVDVNVDNWKYTREAIKGADIIVSHLDRTGRALNVAEFTRKPFVFIVHNSNFVDFIRVKYNAGMPVYCVYNSEFTRTENKYPNPSIIVHPPVDGGRYKSKPLKTKSADLEVEVIKPKRSVKKGEKITLVNLFWKKGGQMFHDIARNLPEYQFLGVEGGYGPQEKGSLDNVQYVQNTTDMKMVYGQTRILLMPSVYESYGRTGIEAMSSGIPVLASPTGGLKEALGEAGIFCKDTAEFVAEIKKLDDKKYYDEVSKRCLSWAKAVEERTEKELTDMEEFFKNILLKKV